MQARALRADARDGRRRRPERRAAGEDGDERPQPGDDAAGYGSEMRSSGSVSASIASWADSRSDSGTSTFTA